MAYGLQSVAKVWSVRLFQQKHLSFTRTFLEIKQQEQVCEKNIARFEVKALHFFARQLQGIFSLDKTFIIIDICKQ